MPRAAPHPPVHAVRVTSKPHPWERAPQWFEFGCFTARGVSFWTPALLAAAAHILAFYICAEWIGTLFDFYSVEDYLRTIATSAGGPPDNWNSNHVLGFGSSILPAQLICTGLTVVFAAAAAGVVAYRAKYEKPLAAHWIFVFVLVGSLGVCVLGAVITFQAWQIRELLRHYAVTCRSPDWTEAACHEYGDWGRLQESRFFILFAAGITSSTVCGLLFGILSIVVGRAYLCAPFEYPEVGQSEVMAATPQRGLMMPYIVQSQPLEAQGPMSASGTFDLAPRTHGSCTQTWPEPHDFRKQHVSDIPVPSGGPVTFYW